MDDLKSRHGQRTGRKIAEKRKVVWSERVTGPKNRLPSPGVEVLHIHYAAASFIVIAADDDGGRSLHHFDDGIGVRAIAHEIAQAENFLVFALRQLQTLFQSFQIGMNIAEDQITHEG